jgi:hypothetical protein
MIQEWQHRFSPSPDAIAFSKPSDDRESAMMGHIKSHRSHSKFSAGGQLPAEGPFPAGGSHNWTNVTV